MSFCLPFYKNEDPEIPSVFHRFFYHFSSLFSYSVNKDDETIRIKLQKYPHINSEMIRYYTSPINEIEIQKNQKLVENCTRSKMVCKNLIFRLRIINFFFKFICSTLPIIIAVLINFKISKKYVISIASLFSITIFFDYFFEWEKCIEKYSYLYTAFNELISSKNCDRFAFYENLVEEFRSSALFTDNLSKDIRFSS
jgi:hypothetical protein